MMILVTLLRLEICRSNFKVEGEKVFKQKFASCLLFFHFLSDYILNWFPNPCIVHPGPFFNQPKNFESCTDLFCYATIIKNRITPII